MLCPSVWMMKLPSVVLEVSELQLQMARGVSGVHGGHHTQQGVEVATQVDSCSGHQLTESHVVGSNGGCGVVAEPDGGVETRRGGVLKETHQGF